MIIGYNACVVGNQSKSPFSLPIVFFEANGKKQDSVLSGSTLSAYKVL